MLSNRLYELSHAESSDGDVLRENQNFQRWIWRWLYLNQSTENLEAELDAISTLINTQHLKSAQLFTLAIKAETIETLLQQ